MTHKTRRVGRRSVTAKARDWLTRCAAAFILVPTPPTLGSDSKDPYAALTKITNVTEKKIEPAGCTVRATVDFEAYRPRLDIFREAWLNRDYSVDFYAQRGRQVFAYTILKRAAELLTEGLYKGHQQPPCSFTLDVTFNDKFGQQKKFEGLSWRFNDEQAHKVNWEKFDPKDFNEIALVYHYGPDVSAWLSSEPSLTGEKGPPPNNECDMLLFKANAIFIRATTICRKNYMDSDAGYAALAGAQKCFPTMAEGDTKSAAMTAMKSLDQAVRQRGRTGACQMVEGLSREVLAKMRQ